jgi:hypothetical protein
MTKKFYTDKDIEELFRSGAKILSVDNDVVLTDLAFEKARKLGMLADADAPPAAPMRPYLSEAKKIQSTPKVDAVSSANPSLPSGEVAKHAVGDRGEGKAAELEKRIRERVAAKLGNQVDAGLLDTIIKRTLKIVRLK